VILAGGRFQVFVATRPVDFRKGMDSLAAVVKVTYEEPNGAVRNRLVYTSDEDSLARISHSG
jgi:hypothetical protein